MKNCEDYKGHNPVAEVPRKGSISSSYFLRMMLPEAMKYAAPYEKEEEETLNRILGTIKNARKLNVAVVGAGTMFYIETLLHRTKSYTAIEPLANLFIQPQFRYLASKFNNIDIVAKDFNKVSRGELRKGAFIWIFIFNIISYLPDPIKQINRLIRPGDIVVISTWAYTNRAKKIRARYFQFLNQEENREVIDGKGDTALSNLGNLSVEEIRHYVRHNRISGKITDFLVIHT